MGGAKIERALLEGIRGLDITEGDTVLVRAAMSAVGPLPKGPKSLIDAFLEIIGQDGTLVSLSFTDSYYLKKPDPNKPFRSDTPTNAGAFPATMLTYPEAKRSKHPTSSYVAIGKHAKFITENHGPKSPAYEPVRKIIDLNGKMALVGCVQSSPGFTTTHLAEYDLGLLNRVIFPWLNTVYYEAEDGSIRLFRRKDLGLCSQSFYKFYSYYVTAGILKTGLIGNAYSIAAPAKDTYAIDKRILRKNPIFNVCDNPLCRLCNARRWDRIHKIPNYVFMRVLRKLERVLSH